MLAKTYTVAVNGLETTTITVEVNIVRGVMFHMTGLPDTAVKESYDRIRSATANQGYKIGLGDIFGIFKPLFTKAALMRS